MFVSKLLLVKVSCNMGMNNTITTASSSSSGAPRRPTSFLNSKYLFFFFVTAVSNLEARRHGCGSRYAVACGLRCGPVHEVSCLSLAVRPAGEGPTVDMVLRSPMANRHAVFFVVCFGRACVLVCLLLVFSKLLFTPS